MSLGAAVAAARRKPTCPPPTRRPRLLATRRGGGGADHLRRQRDVWNAAGPAPTYTVSSTSGAQVQWRLDTGPWSAASASPLVVPLGPVADGEHVLAAREATLLGILPPGAAVAALPRRHDAAAHRHRRAGARAPSTGWASRWRRATPAPGPSTCAGPVAERPAHAHRRAAGRRASGSGRPTTPATQATARGDYSVAPGRATRARPLAGHPGRAPTPSPGGRWACRGPETRGGLVAAGRRPRSRRAAPGAALARRGRAPASTTSSSSSSRARRRARSTRRSRRRRAYRVPRRRRSPFGQRYLWRAWPYMAGGYTAAARGRQLLRRRAGRCA